MQKLSNVFPSSDPGPIGFSTCGHRGAHGVARVETTSDYDTQDYFQILCSSIVKISENANKTDLNVLTRNEMDKI